LPDHIGLRILGIHIAGSLFAWVVATGSSGDFALRGSHTIGLRLPCLRRYTVHTAPTTTCGWLPGSALLLLPVTVRYDDLRLACAFPLRTYMPLTPHTCPFARPLDFDLYTFCTTFTTAFPIYLVSTYVAFTYCNAHILHVSLPRDRTIYLGYPGTHSLFWTTFYVTDYVDTHVYAPALLVLFRRATLPQLLTTLQYTLLLCLAPHTARCPAHTRGSINQQAVWLRCAFVYSIATAALRGVCCLVAPHCCSWF